MAIEQRMERLERQNKRLKASLCALALAGLSLFLMGQMSPQGVPDVIRAKGFEVVDNNGKMLIRLSGIRRWDVTKGSLGPIFGEISIQRALDGENHYQSLVTLSASGPHGGSITTHMARLDGSRIEIGASIDGQGISLFDAEGNLRARLGETRLKVSTTAEEIVRPESSLVLFREDGKVLRSLP